MDRFILGYILFWVFFLFSLIPLFILYRFWFFFRDPIRKIPDGNNIVAPADGVILYIKEIKNKEVPLSIKNGKIIYLNELIDDNVSYNLLIGIYMTPFSVHYNRFPFSGKIRKMYYHERNKNTSMLRVMLNWIFSLQPLEEGADYILENERNTICLSGEKVDFAVVQIADKWIKKIVNRKFSIGDFVNKGDKIGLIRMGSQCDLFLKIDKPYSINVKEKSYVKAGETVLITFD